MERKEKRSDQGCEDSVENSTMSAGAKEDENEEGPENIELLLDGE
jgi:hypothetical protein